MGWASGTEVFERMEDAIITCNATEQTKVGLLKALISTLEDMDWDCQCEVVDNHSLIRRAFQALHPDWKWLFDDDESGDDD